MALFAPVRSETTDLDAVRRYAVRVIAQSEGEDLQMKAAALNAAVAADGAGEGAPAATPSASSSSSSTAALTPLAIR